ncbi:MAG: AMP-dependent synthetase [Gemmatimonadetes bacterium]|nr:MAG: AMP-dependent synthetase [Gemmatimonadota bacterium]
MPENKTFPFGQQIVWQPNPQWIEESNLRAFMERHDILNYEALLKKSTEDIAWFWDAVMEDLDIQFYEPYRQIVDVSDGIQFPKWCVGGKMNIVHNCLDKWQTKETRDNVALRYESEEGHVKVMTYGDLHEEVCRCANALRQLGLGKGDPVGLYMPMIPELAVAFLAIIKIGGVILPLFSGYGAGAVATRLKDARAKAIFTVDGAYRRGKKVPMKIVADEAIQECPTVEHLIVVNRVNLEEVPWTAGRDHWWHELVPGQSPIAETEKTHAEDVMMIIYTSGTTGRPKGAVHTHCGFPIKGAQDMYHPMDVKPDDTMYWMSDMGWMMGPWEVFGTLLIGATMLFFDGAPDYPDVNRLWKLVEDHRVTHLGISPTLIRALKPHGLAPIQKHDLSSLRAVGSTGSPWDPESWLWVFENVLNREKPILNYSGGTEISGGILCGNFFQPLKPCAFSGAVVGMAADVVNEAGEPVRGEVGELVIRQPWIGMTRGFWQDNQRYLDTYWSDFENIWKHGDYAAIDEDGLWYILGRSDDTIKVAGKRLGPAEVEAILNGHPSVTESAAIAVPHPIKDNEVVAFCVLKPGVPVTDELRTELMQRVIDQLGKPLKPKEIRFTTALPKTRNAKVMRRVIRATYLGENPGDVSSLENPETVDAIKASI